MKVYHQRWYVVGYLKEQEGIRNIALDRILEMELTDDSFILPNDLMQKNIMLIQLAYLSMTN